jgi:hypothetical protein
MTLHGFQDLVEYLLTQGVTLTPDNATQVVEIPTTTGALMYLRWEKELPLVQIVHLAVVDIPPERLSAAEHAIALINHAAPLAGLALDHERRFTYFRLTVQLGDDGELGVAALNRALHAVIGCGAEVLPVLSAAISPPAQGAALGVGVDGVQRA